MSEPCRPILPWISWWPKPGVSVSTRKQARPRCPSDGSVWAKIERELGVVAERDPHLRAAEIDQPSSVLRARVFWLAASEPVSGSVRPKQPSHSPEQSLGRYFCFCSSVPHFTSVEHTSDVCTDTTVRIAEQPRPTSSQMIA